MSHLPDIILFDWDGTLADSYALLEAAHNEILDTLGFPPRGGIGWFHFYFGKPRDFVYDDIYGPQRPIAENLFNQFLRANAQKYIKTTRGADSLIKWLKDNSIRMGIVSNKKTFIIRDEIPVFGWEDTFDVIVGGGDTPQSKPSADPIHYALNILKGVENTYPREKIWMVGDTDNDIKSAHAAGLKCIYLSNDNTTPDDILSLKPFQIFQNCEIFLNYLLHCQQKSLKDQ